MPRLPNLTDFDDKPVVHHFDDHTFRGHRPGFLDHRRVPSDILASQSPLDQMTLELDGQGALGSRGYVATHAGDGDQFYCEATPIWWIPARIYDLRDKWITFYLKEVRPITVAPGYAPSLFIAANVPHPEVERGFFIDGWYFNSELTVGKGEWAYNEIQLVNDPGQWFHYSDFVHPGLTQALDWTLGHCGYIGWMYYKDENFRGVQATGAMGWDEVCFNLTEKDLPRVRQGQVPEHALIL